MEFFCIVFVLYFNYAKGWGDVPLGKMERAAGLVVSPSVTRDRTRGCCAGEVVTAVNRASGGCVEGVTCQITTLINIKVSANNGEGQGEGGAGR